MFRLPSSSAASDVYKRQGYNYTLKGSLNVGDQQKKLENNKLELPAYGIVILKQSGVD